MGNYQNALYYARLALNEKLDPVFLSQVYCQLGGAYFCLTSYDEALAAYLAALEKDALNVDACFYLAEIYARLDKEELSNKYKLLAKEIKKESINSGG